MGVDENELSNGAFKIYPNPADHSVYTDITEPANYTLIDILGHEIRSSSVLPGEPILTTDLSSGIYFIFVKGSKINFNRKIIVQH
jgi:hypothetical protein